MAHLDAYALSLLGGALAGLLVGFGTRLGGGCTSGHGVCGLSRFSLRSLVATMSFDAKLVVGAGVFGIGWGLGGICPGPALVDAGGGAVVAIVFVGTMAMGMALSHVVRPAPGR